MLTNNANTGREKQTGYVSNMAEIHNEDVTGQGKGHPDHGQVHILQAQQMMCFPLL